MTIKVRGFTIVELLIVIVVIAILASISVVAYSGISKRAEDSMIASKVKIIAQVFEVYGAANGGLVPQADWACVGEPEDFPAVDDFPAEWCKEPANLEPIPAGSVHPISYTVNAALKTVVDRVPDSNIPIAVEGDGDLWRGILYDSSGGFSGGRPSLDYRVKGVRTSCPLGEVVYTEAESTRCNYVFTNLMSETGT